jgi:predicted component of type VI protein secretion system
MGKLVISLDGVVIKEVPITKDRTTLGRRPYNDIVIDNLAVSGEHAMLQASGSDLFLEDLNSTNGTYVNGKAIRRQALQHNDTIEVGKYKIKFLVDDSDDHERTMVVPPATAQGGSPPSSMFAASTLPASPPPTLPPPVDSAFGLAGTPTAPAASALIRVLNGAAAGREVVLTKVVTTVGKPGIQVASITRRPSGYAFSHVEGTSRPSVNGAPLTAESVALRDGDIIELAGTQMMFVQR